MCVIVIKILLACLRTVQIKCFRVKEIYLTGRARVSPRLHVKSHFLQAVGRVRACVPYMFVVVFARPYSNARVNIVGVLLL